MFSKLTAEFIGTFWLVLGGCGSAVLAAAFPDVGIGLLGVSLAFGLTVVTDEGRELGTLVQIIETGANDVYVVRDGTREHLIPAIADVVVDVDLEARRMTIHAIEGLLD